MIALSEWCQGIVAITAEQVDAGRGDRDVRADLRSGAVAVSKLLAPALVADWQGMLEGQAIEPDGPAPDEPLLRVVWLVRKLALDLWGAIQGEGRGSTREAKQQKERSNELRAAATALAKVLPPDAYVEARIKMAQEARLIKAPTKAPEVKPWPAEPAGELPPSLSLSAASELPPSLSLSAAGEMLPSRSLSAAGEVPPSLGLPAAGERPPARSRRR